MPIFPHWKLYIQNRQIGNLLARFRLPAIESEGNFSWFPVRIYRKINVKSRKKSNHYDEMSRTRQISKVSIIKGDIFWQWLMEFHANVRSRRIAYIMHWSATEWGWAVSSGSVPCSVLWLVLGSVCQRSFFVCFWLSFEYSNYLNSFMVEYSNGKIGICHRPIKYTLKAWFFFV